MTFSPIGVPTEIFTLWSQLNLQTHDQTYCRVGVKAIRTSSYHPQMDGMVERFNGMMKLMLHKLLQKFDA